MEHVRQRRLASALESESDEFWMLLLHQVISDQDSLDLTEKECKNLQHFLQGITSIFKYYCSIIIQY